jgi:orotate phosphoribosyltransferase
MTPEEVLAEFKAAGALLEGHFILSSGLHSSLYLQCALVLQDPKRAERLCQALVARIPTDIRAKIGCVVSPAMGGVIVGYEMARALGVASLFTERVEGQFQFRRGFELTPGVGVLMMEDVVTTGLSSRECIACIEAAGGVVVAAGALIDRSGGQVDLGTPLYALAPLKVPAYPADKLPPDLAHLPAVKPGSRGLKASK